MNKREARQEHHLISLLQEAGFSEAEYLTLRRLSRTLRGWMERCSGTESGCIEFEPMTGRPFWSPASGERIDRRTGAPVRHYLRDTGAIAERSVRRLMERHANWQPYFQGDPRGCALYLIPIDKIQGRSIGSCYSSIGLAIG